MNKIEYNVKKRIIAQFDDDADAHDLAMAGLVKELCGMDESEIEKASLEIEKINSEFIRLAKEENAEEKLINLIERYRKEIERENHMKDEIVDKEAETKL